LNGTHEVEHKYYFIDHYCGRSDELKYKTLSILESGTGEDAHFSITPFEFNDYPGLGFEIVCTISLCYEPFFTCKLPDDFCLSPDKYAGLSDEDLFPKRTTTTKIVTTTQITTTKAVKIPTKESKRRERNEKKRRKGRSISDNGSGRMMRIVNFGLVQPGHNYTLIIPNK